MPREPPTTFPMTRDVRRRLAACPARTLESTHRPFGSNHLYPAVAYDPRPIESPNETNADHRCARAVNCFERHRAAAKRPGTRCDEDRAGGSAARPGTDSRADQRRYPRAAPHLRRRLSRHRTDRRRAQEGRRHRRLHITRADIPVHHDRRGSRSRLWKHRGGNRPLHDGRPGQEQGRSARQSLHARLGHEGRTVAAGGESLFADDRAIAGSRPGAPGHASMRLRPDVALQTGQLLMERAPRALLSIALQLNLGVKRRLSAPARAARDPALGPYPQRTMRTYLHALAVAVLVPSCVLAQPALPARVRLLTAPSDGWTTATPESMGVDARRLATLTASVRAWPELGVHAVLIERSGRLIYEEYFDGFDELWGTPLGRVSMAAGSIHDVRSVTKSVVSALAGIAVGEGAIKSLDQPLVEWFPEYPDLNTADRRRLTLAHVLGMTSGLEWNEDMPYTDPRNDEIRMTRDPDPLRYALSRAFAHDPGAEFNYNGGLVQAMA